MESPKITVIVPVYNVAAYIEKCAISLFQQTLDSLELLTLLFSFIERKLSYFR